MSIKKILLFFFSLFFSVSVFAEEFPVRITSDLPFATISHEGIPVRVKRIQDQDNKLVDDFAKTSRKCPPFCVQPMEISSEIKTIGELELIHFLNTEVENNTGLLIDARMPKFYQSETIPGSVNVPFVLFSGKRQKKVFNLLGIKVDKNNKYDFSDAPKLALFCNGPWCGQSPTAIKALVKAGYPQSQLLYYRGGMQLWKIFSLTTVLPNGNVVTQDNLEIKK